MSEMLRSIRADLTSRRLLPFVVLALGLFVGAVAYAVLGSKASSAPVASGRSVTAPTVQGPAVSSAPANPNSAVAETTTGGRYQHRGHVHNPFAPLPGSKSEVTTTTSSSSASSEPSTGGSEPSSGTGTTSVEEGGSEPGASSAPPPSEAPPPPVSVFAVTATLAQVGESGSPQEFLALDELKPLPGKHEALITYAGAQDAGNGALFLLVKPLIVHGDARCLPAKTSCESIYVKAKQSEELQYLQPNGTVVSYTLKLARVASSTLPAQEAAEHAQAQARKQDGELESLGVALPHGVAFSQDVPGVLTGLGAALEAAKKAE